MITVTVDTGTLRNRLRNISTLCEVPRAALQAAGRAVEGLLVRHFAKKDLTPNRLGGRRTHFWADIGASTQITETTPTYCIVNIGDPRFPQKVYGGTIVPKNVKWLTIPAIPEAHGRRAAVFETETGIKLRFVPLAADKAELREVVSTVLRKRRLGENAGRKKRDQDTGGRTVYWLRKSVTQGPDKTAMPERQQIEYTALTGAEDYLRTKIAEENRP